MFDRFARCLFLLLIGGTLGFRPAVAQWWVDAAVGGASHEAVTAHVDANSALLGLRREGTLWFQLAGGVPLGSDGARWGSVAGGTEFMRPGRISYGVLAGGQSYAYSASSLDSRGWGGIGEIGPSVRYSGAELDVEVRAGGIGSWAVVDDFSTERLLFTSAGHVGRRLPHSLTIAGAAQYVVAAEAGYPFFGATLAQSFAQGGWWARVGQWRSDEIERPEWSVGAYASPGGRFQIHGMYRQETNDPIYQRLPRRSWSFGLSYVITRRTPIRPESPAIILESERVTVRIPADEIEGAPSIAGDFNGWTLVPMIRSGDHWSLTLSLDPGVYRFSFRDAQGNWFLPPSVTNRVDDGFGGENGVIVVS